MSEVRIDQTGNVERKSQLSNSYQDAYGDVCDDDYDKDLSNDVSTKPFETFDDAID